MTQVTYISVMNNNANDSKAQGADELEEIEVKKISDWLLRDLTGMISLLAALREDAELRQYMAYWFHGRMVNAKHKEGVSNGKA